MSLVASIEFMGREDKVVCAMDLLPNHGGNELRNAGTFNRAALNTLNRDVKAAVQSLLLLPENPGLMADLMTASRHLTTYFEENLNEAGRKMWKRFKQNLRSLSTNMTLKVSTDLKECIWMHLFQSGKSRGESLSSFLGQTLPVFYYHFREAVSIDGERDRQKRLLVVRDKAVDPGDEELKRLQALSSHGVSLLQCNGNGMKVGTVMRDVWTGRAGRAEVVHLCCHYGFDDINEDYWWQLGDDRRRIYSKTIWASRAPKGVPPFLFMNCCRGAVAGGHERKSIVHELYPRYIKGCVTTICDVPPEKAVVFASGFYNRLFTQHSYGNSFFQTVQELSKQEDPTGFAYAMLETSVNMGFE